MKAVEIREYRIETLSFMSYNELMQSLDNAACMIESSEDYIREMTRRTTFETGESKKQLRKLIRDEQDYLSNNVEGMRLLNVEITLRDQRKHQSQ